MALATSRLAWSDPAAGASADLAFQTNGSFLHASGRFFQAWRKENQRKSKKKGFDFLGIPCPKRAFSMGYADPLGIFSLSAFLAE
jgi:hypothetical protein